MAFNSSGYLLNQGRVFLRERQFNGPATSGWVWVGDADNVSLSMSQKTDDIMDSFTGSGMIVASPVTETTAELTINVLDMQLKNWATATWGDNSGAKASGSVSGESIVLYNGEYVKLGNIGVSNVNVAGATLNTDYVLDTAAHGMLRVLSTSPAAPAGTPLSTTVSYDYAANNGKVEAFVLGQKFYSVMVAGINTAQGNQPTVLTIKQIQLGVSKKFDMIAKKHVAFELAGKVMYDQSLPLATTAGDLSNLFTWEAA
jgi:hypothetical protein